MALSQAQRQKRKQQKSSKQKQKQLQKQRKLRQEAQQIKREEILDQRMAALADAFPDMTEEQLRQLAAEPDAVNKRLRDKSAEAQVMGYIGVAGPSASSEDILQELGKYCSFTVVDQEKWEPGLAMVEDLELSMEDGCTVKMMLQSKDKTALSQLIKEGKRHIQPGFVKSQFAWLVLVSGPEGDDIDRRKAEFTTFWNIFKAVYACAPVCFFESHNNWIAGEDNLKKLYESSWQDAMLQMIFLREKVKRTSGGTVCISTDCMRIFGENDLEIDGIPAAAQEEGFTCLQTLFLRYLEHKLNLEEGAVYARKDGTELSVTLSPSKCTAYNTFKFSLCGENCLI